MPRLTQPNRAVLAVIGLVIVPVLGYWLMFATGYGGNSGLTGESTRTRADTHASFTSDTHSTVMNAPSSCPSDPFHTALHQRENNLLDAIHRICQVHRSLSKLGVDPVLVTQGGTSRSSRGEKPRSELHPLLQQHLRHMSTNNASLYALFGIQMPTVTWKPASATDKQERDHDEYDDEYDFDDDEESKYGATLMFPRVKSVDGILDDSGKDRLLLGIQDCLLRLAPGKAGDEEKEEKQEEDILHIHRQEDILHIHRQEDATNPEHVFKTIVRAGDILLHDEMRTVYDGWFVPAAQAATLARQEREAERQRMSRSQVKGSGSGGSWSAWLLGGNDEANGDGDGEPRGGTGPQMDRMATGGRHEVLGWRGLCRQATRVEKECVLIGADDRRARSERVE
ncbi:hypothetical protein GGR56DRAFT_155111 [Xylariaceae sp. FL0804]|nr:hypothetical protein GGR56DRAFT_155111 [Xylariaceae sp. FL0804]